MPTWSYHHYNLESLVQEGIFRLSKEKQNIKLTEKALTDNLSFLQNMLEQWWPRTWGSSQPMSDLT